MRVIFGILGCLNIGGDAGLRSNQLTVARASDATGRDQLTPPILLSRQGIFTVLLRFSCSYA
jgi:hypothetical protein